MKTIKQDDEHSCVACVVAMITQTSVEEFRKFINYNNPPYTDRDAARYLLWHGYAMGIGFDNGNKEVLEPEDTIQITFDLKDYEAYVVVTSMRFPGEYHAVYWDGERIHDPNPDIKGAGLPLNEYVVHSWFPVYKVKESKK